MLQNRAAFVRRASARGNLTEAAAEDIADALDADLQAPATKVDVAELRTKIAELRTEMAELRAELKGDIAAVRTEIERNFNRSLMIQVTLLGALFAALRLT